MSTPRLYTVFEYLATLIAERGPDEPFMLTQLQPAISYKFPDFRFEAYQIAGFKEFITAGEKAGYFKLVNTGSMQTAYLVPGQKHPQSATIGVVANTATEDMAANDPRRTRWMTLAMENMLSAERGDQIIDAIKNVDALTPEFDTFLETQIKTTPLYPTRGKLKRLRDFLRILRAKGEAQAIAQWQISRTVLRMPPTPPIDGVGQAQSLIWSILQGNTSLSNIPVDSLNNFFFAVLNFSREYMMRNKSWDWVIALDMLETEARAVPRPVPPPQKKAGLFGGKQAPPPPSNELDEAKIAALTEQMKQAAGFTQTENANLPTWKAYVATPSLDTSFRFLMEHAKLVEDEQLVTWLDDQITENVASGTIDIVRNLANKAALVLGVRQFGFDGVRQNSGELKNIYESIMEGAKLLSSVYGFIEAPDPQQAAQYFAQHSELNGEDIGTMFEDQLIKAAHRDDVTAYQRINERLDLWRNLLDFDFDEALRQHSRYLHSGQDEKHVQAAMGLLLLGEAHSADEKQDIIGRYPSVASKIGQEMAQHTLDVLSFQKADADVYNHHYEIKRLIDRCLELGVDRALAELK